MPDQIGHDGGKAETEMKRLFAIIKQAIARQRARKRSKFAKAWAVTWRAVLAAIILYFPLGRYLPYIGIDRDNSFYLSHYYNEVNKEYTAAEGEDVITIINTQYLDDETARKDIADVIKAVCALNPKAVGVDIRFPSHKDSASDAYLKAVVRANRDKVVLAQAVHNGELMPSIFAVDSIQYGLTNLPGYAKYDPYMTVGEKRYPLFSYAVADVARPGGEVNFKRFLVNYSSVLFDSFNAEAFLGSSVDVQRRLIDGKVILIGDIDHAKDYHDTPFLIEGQNYMGGLYLQAYAVYSLVDKDRALKKLPFMLNLLFCCFFCYVFALLFVTLTDEKLISKVKFFSKCPGVFHFICPLLLILADFLVFWICHKTLTVKAGLIPDVVLYMIAVLLINTFDDFVSNRINPS